MTDQNKESNIIFNIMFIGLFCGIMLLATILIIASLNQGNTSQRTVVNQSLTQILPFSTETYTLSSGIISPVCSNIVIRDILGNTISADHFIINNCEVTYTS
jgi:hypothetical protein